MEILVLSKKNHAILWNLAFHTFSFFWYPYLNYGYLCIFEAIFIFIICENLKKNENYNYNLQNLSSFDIHIANYKILSVLEKMWYFVEMLVF